MKVTVTVGGTLTRPVFGRVADHVRRVVQSVVTNHEIERELADELRAVSASERAADPELRRDALERAVRRHFGGTL